MAPTAMVVDELYIVKENLDIILSDIRKTVELLKKKEQAISHTRDKVEKVYQLLRDQGDGDLLMFGEATEGNNEKLQKETTKGETELPRLKKVTEIETELNSLEELTESDATIFDLYCKGPGQGHVGDKVQTGIQVGCLVRPKDCLGLSVDGTASNGSKSRLYSQIENNFDVTVDASKLGVEKKQNVVEYFANLDSEQEDVVSDCDSVVSVRPTVKRSSVESGGLGVASRGEAKVTHPPTGQVEKEGHNGSHYIDYHDPGEELFLWEMPPENERGHRRDPVELTDMQNLYLLGPGARGMERVSTRARVALRMRVHKGRNGVLVYGIPEAIDKAKDMLNQITKHVVKEMDVSSIMGHQGVRGRLLSTNAGVVVQIQGEHGQGRVVELVGLPAGVKKARKMIQDPMM